MEGCSARGRVRSAGLVVCAAAALCFVSAAPRVVSSVAAGDEGIEYAVTGRGIGTIRSLQMVLSYDPSEVAVVDALISSPTPETAFSAMVDTAANELTVMVVAASTVEIVDDAVIVSMKIPLEGPGGSTQGPVIREASLVDADGNVVAIEIGPTRAGRRATLRSMRAYRAATRGGGKAIFSPLGRRVPMESVGVRAGVYFRPAHATGPAARQVQPAPGR